MTLSTRRIASKRGFTLIELLVVIAIIAILAAILFPVFAQAREKARAITCTSNMKELGTAFLMYSQDFDEQLPSPGGASGVTASWDQLSAIDGGSTGNAASSARGSVPLVNLVLDPYLKNRGQSATSIWCCPDLISGPQPSTSGTNYLCPNDTYAYPRTYTMNGLLRSPGTTKGVTGAYLGVTISDPDAYSVVSPAPGGSYGYKYLNGLQGITSALIPEPSGTVMLFEGDPEADPGADYNGSTGRAGDFTTAAGYGVSAAGCKTYYGYACQANGISPMHGGGVDNWLYCDGHVKSHPPVTTAVWAGGTGGSANPIPSSGADYRLTEFLVKHCRSGSSICP